MPSEKSRRARNSGKTTVRSKKPENRKHQVPLNRVVAASAISVMLFAVAVGMLVSADEPANIETREPAVAESALMEPDAAVKLAKVTPSTATGGRESESNTVSVQQPGVTLTGCLARENEAFRLEKASGANAPKSRSWKSGFLKKRPMSIELVDASGRLTLEELTGQRVSVTGTLDNREMHVRSVQRIARVCT